MAAEMSVTILAELTGLGLDRVFSGKFSTTNVPARALYQYMTQATADTAEALDVSDVSTIDLIIIKCILNDVDIDCDYVSTFDADITIQEGEIAVFKPAGTVYFKNNGAGEQSTIEYMVVGSA